MSKFKVGDRVRILHSDYDGCGLDVGTTHDVASLWGKGFELRGCGPYNKGDPLYFSDQEVELVKPINTITVGETYTSANGNKWECIFVRDGKAWMKIDGINGAAYLWYVDGTSILSTHYDIVFEPVRETVTRHISYNGTIMSVNFDLIDGLPDWSTAKVGACK